MIKLLLLAFIIINPVLIFAQSEAPEPFLTDYCTGYPEGTLEHPHLWKHCCLEHDLYFWAGGSHEDRKDSDLLLRECIQDTGEEFQAKLIYWAVTAGAYSPIKFSNKKWNYGWSDRHQHRKLSLQDIDKIEKEILKSQYQEFDPLTIERFLSTLRSR